MRERTRSPSACVTQALRSRPEAGRGRELADDGHCPVVLRRGARRGRRRAGRDRSCEADRPPPRRGDRAPRCLPVPVCVDGLSIDALYARRARAAAGSTNRRTAIRGRGARVRGRIAAHRGRRAQAVDDLQQALRIARATGMAFMGPVFLGMLALAADDPATARTSRSLRPNHCSPTTRWRTTTSCSCRDAIDACLECKRRRRRAAPCLSRSKRAPGRSRCHGATSTSPGLARWHRASSGRTIRRRSGNSSACGSKGTRSACPWR